MKWKNISIKRTLKKYDLAIHIRFLNVMQMLQPHALVIFFNECCGCQSVSFYTANPLNTCV